MGSLDSTGQTAPVQGCHQVGCSMRSRFRRMDVQRSTGHGNRLRNRSTRASANGQSTHRKLGNIPKDKSLPE